MLICPYCEGTKFNELGVWGSLIHLRCQACGMNTTTPQDSNEIADADYYDDEG